MCLVTKTQKDITIRLPNPTHFLNRWRNMFNKIRTEISSLETPTEILPTNEPTFDIEVVTINLALS